MHCMKKELWLRRKTRIHICFFYLVSIYIFCFYCWLYILKNAVMCFQKKKETIKSEYSVVENKMKNWAEDGS